MSVAAVESYLRASECGIVSAAALLTFDHCLTFGKEVEWLIGTKWTAARIHFTALRYLPFVAIAMAIPTSQVRLPLQTSYCGTFGTVTNVLYYLCIVLAEAMLIVRTYAFWKRNKRILVGMCIFGVVCMVTAIVVSETVYSQPTNVIYKSLNCLGIEGSVPTAIQYICLILYEMGMLALNWIAFRRMKYHNPPGRLIITLYRDGVMYVAAILIFSVINTVFTLTTPIQYSDILNSPQMVMHAILASRIFFNLRETTRREQRNSLPTPLSDFRVAPQNFSTPSSSFGSSTSNGGVGPSKMVDTTQVMEISRENMAQIS